MEVIDEYWRLNYYNIERIFCGDLLRAVLCRVKWIVIKCSSGDAFSAEHMDPDRLQFSA